MWQYGIKVLITALMVVAISEAAKRWTLVGAIIASLPLTSILAMIWMYTDSGNIEKINSLSYGIFWIVIPSLVFFLLFPLFTKQGFNFWISLSASSLITAATYVGYIRLITMMGIKI